MTNNILSKALDKLGESHSSKKNMSIHEYHSNNVDSLLKDNNVEYTKSKKKHHPLGFGYFIYGLPPLGYGLVHDYCNHNNGNNGCPPANVNNTTAPSSSNVSTGSTGSSSPVSGSAPPSSGGTIS